jgi:uncharacterized protein (TIGR03000 family)
MRTRWLLSGLSLLLGSSVALAQAPNLARPEMPRPLPELPAASLADKKPALVKLNVPEDATVWFESQKMTQPGMTRMFQTPGLELKKTYYYKVKVAWPTGAGSLAKEFVTEQEVAVRAGETTTVDFTPLASHTKEVKPTSTRDMIRQAAHKTPAPRKGTVKARDDD